jgi:hypothetical protein
MDLTASPPPLPPLDPRQDPPSPPTLKTDETRVRVLSAIFHPIVATQAEYEALFHDEGFGDFTDINIRPAYGFVRFSSLARIDLFVEHFHGFVFRDQPISSSRARSAATCKTLHLSGLSPGASCERSIYLEFSPYGFIRRIASKRDFAFVEFDTVDDAEMAFNACKKKGEVTIEGSAVKISYAKNEHRVDRQNLSVRLADILPEGHKFWRQLQKLTSDH